MSGILCKGLSNDSSMISLFPFSITFILKSFSRNGLRVSVEAFLDFDEESFVFIAGFIAVSLSGDSATNLNQIRPHKQCLRTCKNSARNRTSRDGDR